MPTSKFGQPTWGDANYDVGTTGGGGGGGGGGTDVSTWGLASSQINSYDKQGGQRLIQMADGTFTAGHLVKFNTDGSVTDAGPALFSPTCYLPGRPGAAGVVMAIDVPSTISTVSFPANFSGSVGKCGTNPTSTATYTVKVSGSSIGTFSISTSGTFSWSTTGGAAQSAAASADITVTAPSSQDATLSDVRFTLYGTR